MACEDGDAKVKGKLPGVGSADRRESCWLTRSKCPLSLSMALANPAPLIFFSIELAFSKAGVPPRRKPSRPLFFRVQVVVELGIVNGESISLPSGPLHLWFRCLNHYTSFPDIHIFQRRLVRLVKRAPFDSESRVVKALGNHFQCLVAAHEWTYEIRTFIVEPTSVFLLPKRESSLPRTQLSGSVNRFNMGFWFHAKSKIMDGLHSSFF